MVRILSKLGKEGNFINLVKNIYRYLQQAYLIVGSERFSPKIKNKAKLFTLTVPPHNYTGSPSYYHKTTKSGKILTDGKGRHEMLYPQMT